MTDRTRTLQELAERIRAYEPVEDAWLAKSFTDQLLVVDVSSDERLPPEIETLVADHGLVGVNDVYGTHSAETSFMGAVGGADRHQFVDVETRGDHQSYVVE